MMASQTGGARPALGGGAGLPRRFRPLCTGASATAAETGVRVRVSAAQGRAAEREAQNQGFLVSAPDRRLARLHVEGNFTDRRALPSARNPPCNTQRQPGACAPTHGVLQPTGALLPAQLRLDSSTAPELRSAIRSAKDTPLSHRRDHPKQEGRPWTLRITLRFLSAVQL